MPLNLEDKRAIVVSVNAAASEALSAVVADYRGLSVAEMTNLRLKARETGVYLKVVRNTLAKRAVAGTEYECLTDALVGPTVLAFSQEDPGAAARLIKDFAKDHDALEVKALAIGGVAYDAKDIDILAKLPTRDEAIAQLMSVMQAPVAKFVRTLNEVPGKFVRTMAAVKDKKQQEAA
ncbi:MAG: 50S ribosomal protein L10 [Alloalcanivorax venustensis]|uniref:50S ribosomal protein L10 n=1 Tax=Alloalcanivorax venustensis TaxID=172371 RepID=UPI000E9E0FED|nr:50S ribosomal protein L10 [Alcanivorax sp.]MEA3260547.1 50S ribosomal protein L10 [Pseudomonadota bacterium]SMO84182.1 LSU ribosomal protein L10P [Alcanivorax sp. DSM 26295]MEC8879129.1 50S ribosomal protein L10 [Pseudomonadota bacterium]MED5601953.1 50S ribosomal protein L10 [Pseudomonadota bacterium]